MDFPRHIMERVERLYSYHQRTKIMAMGSRYAPPEDAAYRPADRRTFPDHPKAPLPATLLDAPVGMLTLLCAGQDALPESLRAPPQDLKTLASWLYYAAGESKRVSGRGTAYARAFPDPEEAGACEVYVAAFAVKGLEPGLYHFCPREFALRRLRDGPGALMQIKKGRPDLEFLKTLPAVFLVSGAYWRAGWRYGLRGYRALLLEVGQTVQNLVVAGAGLGAQTVTRLRMNDSTMRELLGVRLDEPLGAAESVHAMVAWADRAAEPIVVPARAANSGLPPIPRPPLSKMVAEDSPAAEAVVVHQDCVAPGVAVQQIRPPLTEMSPMPAAHPPADVPPDDGAEAGLPVRQVLLERRGSPSLLRQAIARPALLRITRVAFRGGSFFPLFPTGSHVAAVRPFWILQDVTGMDRGLWYYDPITDRWHRLSTGQYRRQAKYIAGDRPVFGEAAAVCVMTANLHQLMTQGGPDTYRLAHLEAGIAAQRMYLAATSLGLGCTTAPDYYDEDARAFFGLAKTGWEALNLVALGVRGDGRPATEDRARALGQVGLFRD